MFDLFKEVYAFMHLAGIAIALMGFIILIIYYIYGFIKEKRGNKK